MPTLQFYPSSVAVLLGRVESLRLPILNPSCPPLYKGREFGVGASSPEVEATDIRIFKQVFSSSFIPVISHLQDITVIRILKGHGGLLLHDETGNPGFFDLNNLLKDRLDPFGRKSEGGFIEKEEFGLDHQGPRQGEHLLFSSAHLLCLSLLHLHQSGKEAIDPVQGFILFKSVLDGPRTHIKVLLNAHVRKNNPSLGIKGQALLHNLVRRIVGDLLI